MSRHTPGPWAIEAHTTYPTDAVRISGPDGFQIAATRQLHDYRPDKTAAWYEARANATLMAAAPDLLETLRKVDAWVAQYHDLPGHDAASRQMSKVIRAAIEKAEGHA